MYKFSKKTQRNNPAVTNVIIGAISALAIGFAQCIIVTIMAEKEIIPLSAMSLATMFIHFSSAFVGTFLTQKLSNSKWAIVAGITAAIYIAVLIITSMLFFSGKMSGVLSGVAAVIVGAAASCFVVFRLANHSTKMKRKSIYR